MTGVLDGIKVIDLTRIFAGPMATQALGDLGADVIKVEGISGDHSRTMGADAERLKALGGVSPVFLAMNRNKRSIVLDLHLETARDALLHLAKSADVLIHNFRPGVMERWGLDYAKVSAENKRIIYAEFSAFGETGPMGKAGANDVAMQAYSGLLSVTGHAGEPPARCGTAVVDMHGSMALTSAILAALYHRERTGEGQRVKSSLLRNAAQLMSHLYADYLADGTIAQPLGTANNLSVPNQAFPTLDGSVVIIAGADEMWARCANALDPERLGVPEYQRTYDRLAKRDRLVALLSSITGKMKSADLIRKLQDARVNVSIVNTIPAAVASEQLAEIGGWFELKGERILPKAVATPFELEKAPGKVRHLPPRLGADSVAILSEAGFSEDQIRTLRESGALGK